MSELHPDLARVIIQTEDIQKRVSELAQQISKDFVNNDQVFLIGILKGAFIFLADLARQLTIPHTVDFMALSSYGKTSTSGAVRILMDLRDSIYNKNVIIIEDIIDSGHTLHYLYRSLKGRKPASLHTCVLLQKKRDQLDVPIDYRGFEIPDVWVVGYGLDFADMHRTLPFIAELKQNVIFAMEEPEIKAEA